MKGHADTDRLEKVASLSARGAMAESERIAVSLKYADGVPCWCEQCTARRLANAIPTS